jgi:hypothetical protein
MEYLAANHLIPAGQYVTGNKVRGIRDYDLSKNPLNYLDLGFDLTGPKVHADGEIWNGVNYDLRAAFIKKYGPGSVALSKSCAEGKTPVTKCPGDRRWIQLVYDGWLLMANGNVSMLDARDAMLTATHLRFEVAASQCSGNPEYAGQQTNDPNVPTDCVTGSTISGQVRAADFQVFAH